MKNPVMELMVKVEYPMFSVRVWWTDDNTAGIVVKRRVLDVIGRFDFTMNFKMAAVEISKISDNVAAVEIVDNQGLGVVYYPDWK